ncbi:hypothetical protein D3C71_2077220 [compost metagenome]
MEHEISSVGESYRNSTWWHITIKKNYGIKLFTLNVQRGDYMKTRSPFAEIEPEQLQARIPGVS